MQSERSGEQSSRMTSKRKYSKLLSNCNTLSVREASFHAHQTLTRYQISICVQNRNKATTPYWARPKRMQNMAVSEVSIASIKSRNIIWARPNCTAKREGFCDVQSSQQNKTNLTENAFLRRPPSTAFLLATWQAASDGGDVLRLHTNPAGNA